MKDNEIKKRLFSIGEMIDEFFNSNTPILNNTYSFLEQIQRIAFGIEENKNMNNINPLFKNCITISCHASTGEESETPASIGYIVNFNDPKQINISSARFSRAKELNKARYDSIYFSLTTLIDLASGINISKPINVISDSLETIQELNGEKECESENIKHKRDTILELTQELNNISVIFTWKPTDSTPDLLESKNLAQNLLSAKNH